MTNSKVNQPQTTQTHSLPVMTQEEFNKLLKIAISNDISEHLKKKDLSQVLPDADTLARAFANLSSQQQLNIWQSIGAPYLKTLFASDKKGMVNLNVADLFIKLLGQKILRVDDCIKTKKDLITFLTLLPATDKIWNYMSRSIPETTRRRFFTGKGTLSAFLEEYQGDANQFVNLFTDYKALGANKPGNLAGNIGNMNDCLKRITNPDLRVNFIKSLQYHPNHLSDFNDEELTLVLGELIKPTDLVNVLTRCSTQLSERPQVLSLLLNGRTDDMNIASVLVTKYLSTIPADEWVKNWRVIASHLANNENAADILMAFKDEKTVKEILDSYEHLINILNPIITQKELYQRWVNQLLLPQGVWKLYADLDESKKDYRRKKIDSELASGFLALVLLPVVVVISILGLIPALVAGAIHLAKVKPSEAELETHLKEYPDISADSLIRGYERQKGFHESLKSQSEKNSGLFQQKTKETPEPSLHFVDANKPLAQ